MIEPAAVAAAGAVAGAVVSVSARDGRVVAIGLLVAMAAAHLVASPLPESLSVAARIVGAVLAAYLVWSSARGVHRESAGSALGLAAETAVAAAAFAVGLSVSMVNPLPGPAVAQAAGLALIVLAVVPLLGRDPLRLGVGVAILVLGCSLLTAAWLGATPPLAHFAVAALLVGIVAIASMTIALQPSLGSEGSELVPAPVTAGAPAASGMLRSRPSRPRERAKSQSVQASVWTQAEQSEPDAVTADPAAEILEAGAVAEAAPGPEPRETGETPAPTAEADTTPRPSRPRRAPRSSEP
jgi:hypothetical protein